MKRLLIVAAACAAATSATAQPQTQASAPVPVTGATALPAKEAGRRAYTSTCARCHGIGLVVTSSAYFDLRSFPKEEKARFLDSVTNGKRQMPAWGGILKPEVIESIWLYIGEVNGW